MDAFLKSWQSAMLNQEESNILNRSITYKETEIQSNTKPPHQKK